MNVIDQAKELASLIKKIGDVELYRRIVELEGEIIELTRSKRELEESKRNLESQLALKKSISFESPFYFQEGDEIPICPRCWEKDDRLVHLTGCPPRKVTAYECTVCLVKFEARAFTSGERGWVIARYPTKP